MRYVMRSVIRCESKCQCKSSNKHECIKNYNKRKCTRLIIREKMTVMLLKSAGKFNADKEMFNTGLENICTCIIIRYNYQKKLE